MSAPVPGPVANYRRASTDDQAARETPKNQRIDLDKFAAYHGLETVDDYADEGVSGTMPFADRPEGARLLRDAKAGRFKTVLVWRLDRLARDPLVLLTAIAELRKCGVRVYSVTESIDCESPMGRMMTTMLGGFAEQERLAILARSAAGIRRKLGEGAWLGGPVPFGYRLGDDGGLVVSEATIPGTHYSEADIVRRIFRMSAEERLTNSAIARQLNEEGIPTPTYRDGKAKSKGATPRFGWQPASVRRLLVNALYRGEYVYGRNGVRKGTRQSVAIAEQPPIVPVALWDAAQEALRHNLAFSQRNRRREYTLRGLVLCGTCGIRYVGTGSGSGASGRQYYRCSGSVGLHGPYGERGEKCPSVWVRAGELEELVWADIEEFRRNPGSVIQRLRVKMGEESARADDLQAELLEAQRQLSGQDAERDSILVLFRKGRITEAALDRQLDAIAAEEAALQARVESLRDRVKAAESTQATLASAEATLRELETVEVSDPATKRRIIERLVERVTVCTLGEGKEREAEVEIRYYFGSPEERRIVERMDWDL